MGYLHMFHHGFLYSHSLKADFSTSCFMLFTLSLCDKDGCRDLCAGCHVLVNQMKCHIRGSCHCLSISCFRGELYNNGVSFNCAQQKHKACNIFIVNFSFRVVETFMAVDCSTLSPALS